MLTDRELQRLSNMGNECEDAANEIAELRAERDSLRVNATRYQWLHENSSIWSWQPSRYSPDIVSGFSCDGTGYLGYGFESALDIAIAKGSGNG